MHDHNIIEMSVALPHHIAEHSHLELNKNYSLIQASCFLFVGDRMIFMYTVNCVILDIILIWFTLFADIQTNVHLKVISVCICARKWMFSFESGENYLQNPDIL